MSCKDSKRYDRHKKLLGKVVAASRVARGLSQAVTARKADVSLRFLSQIEHGETNPSVKTMLKICDVLDTTLVDLLENAGIETLAKKDRKEVDELQINLEIEDNAGRQLLKLLRSLDKEKLRTALDIFNIAPNLQIRRKR